MTWICSTAQIVRVIALVNFFLLPAITWGVNSEGVDNLNLSFNGVVAGYENSSGLSLSLAEASMPLAISNSADWNGLTKDTAYFMGYQLSIIGVLYAMPASISGWSDETKDDFSIQQYKDNISQIVWDKDDWWLNYVLHPYWGGVYYVRAQERGFGAVGSFWYSATLSAIYEFGAEAFFEKPSIQDLIVTPGAGYFVGKYFMGVRAGIQKKPPGQLSTSDKFILVMTDPMGALNEEVDGWFGKNTQASLRPMFGPQFRMAVVNKTRFEGSRQLSYIGTPSFGVKMTLRW